MAVIITIMVLDLKPPRSGEPGALVGLWPSFAIYLVSFFLTTIYWINHHGLITQARWVTAGLLWANSGVLFCASLIPFATAYVRQTRLAPFPTAIYAGLQCVCGVAFNVLFSTIVQQRDDEAFRRRVRIRRRQNLAAVTVYALSALVALFVPILAIMLFAAVSLLYVAPTYPRPQKVRVGTWARAPQSAWCATIGYSAAVRHGSEGHQCSCGRSTVGSTLCPGRGEMTAAPASRPATSARSIGSVHPCDAGAKRPPVHGWHHGAAHASVGLRGLFGARRAPEIC
jgi:uncharacterized membrane protein